MTREEEIKIRAARESTILNSELVKVHGAFKAAEAARCLRMNLDKTKHVLQVMVDNRKLEKVRDPSCRNGGVMYRVPHPNILTMDWRVDHEIYAILEEECRLAW
jgi:hypothetical protein